MNATLIHPADVEHLKGVASWPMGEFLLCRPVSAPMVWSEEDQGFKIRGTSEPNCWCNETETFRDAVVASLRPHEQIP
jgi:hypothetical protein